MMTRLVGIQTRTFRMGIQLHIDEVRCAISVNVKAKIVMATFGIHMKNDK